jgi:hypothetical protein
MTTTVKVRDLKPGDVIPTDRGRFYTVARVEIVPVSGWQEGRDDYEVAYLTCDGPIVPNVTLDPDETLEVLA